MRPRTDKNPQELQTLAERYQLLETIGVGASAVVYRAWDTHLQVERAIKMLRTGLSEADQERLHSEARAMARLAHENILPVYDSGLHDGQDFLVLGFADGGSAADLLERHGPLHVSEVARIGASVAAGLQAAHTSGVVHRDIKPSNLLFDAEHRVMIADFGVAKMSDAHHDTMIGSTMGTLAFMAPEQRRDARHVGPEADIYALGATLFLLATDENPVDLFTDPPRGGRWVLLPDALQRVLWRATRLDPRERYQNAAQMASALQNASAKLSKGPELPSLTPAVELSLPTEIIHQYRRSLGTSAEVLEGGIDRLSNDGARKKLRQVAHRLKGSGGAYGFPSVSEAAAGFLKRPSRESLARLVSEAKRAASPGEKGQVERVMVVSTDTATRELICLSVSAPGRQVVTVNSSTEALDVIESRPVSVVVLDLSVADMDGRALLERIIERSMVPPRVIAVVNHLPKELETELWALGARATFPKPIDPVRLASRTKQLFQSNRPTTQLDPGGLPDRAEFLTRVMEARDASGSKPWSVVLISPADAATIEAVKQGMASQDQLARWDETTLALAVQDHPGAPASEWIREIMTPERRAGMAGGTHLNVRDLLVAASRMHSGSRAGDLAIAEPQASTATVLVVEDDPAMVNLIRHVLTPTGAGVIHFDDGREALTAVEADPLPNLIVLDVEMPGLDGLSVLQVLRSTDRFDGVPIVMVTSRGDDRDVQLAFELGANDYVLKPTSPPMLRARLLRLLSKRA